MKGKKKEKNFKFVAVVIFAFIVGFVMGYMADSFINCNKNVTTDIKEETKDGISDEGKISEKKSEIQDGNTISNENVGSLAELKEKLEKELGKYDGQWSLYVENLSLKKIIHL